MIKLATPDYKINRGRFVKGFDPRRHKFTQDECVEGFWRAIESIVERFPDMVDSNNIHKVKYFLRRKKK